MATLSATITQSCAANGGAFHLTLAAPGPGAGPNLVYSWLVLDADNTDHGGTFDVALLPVSAEGLDNGAYQVQVKAVDQDNGSEYISTVRRLSLSCTGPGGGGPVCNLEINNVVVTNPTVAGGTGLVSMSVSTRAQTFTAVIVRIAEDGTEARYPQPPIYTPGPLSFEFQAIGNYRVEVTDRNNCKAEATYAIVAPAVVRGCMDEDASNYDPLATESDPTSCVFTPRWVGVWSPDGVPVWYRPSAVPSVAFVSAHLYIGFPEGHSLDTVRPLAYVQTIRATVTPQGVAMFNLAPYLRSELGALQLDGSRRLDVNSATAQTEDLYIGFRLDIDGQQIARGYALNSALRENRLEELRTGQDPLWPFGKTLPRWPGFEYRVSCLVNDASGRLGKVEAILGEADGDNDWREVHLPCPSNALPVAWLSPEGGYGFWVFRGRHAYGDEIGEGVPYTEAGTNELRYSSRAASRETVEAYSGVFSDRALVEGLRTLRRAVQAWYQPEPSGPWVPIVLKSGMFPAYREGRRRYEATVQFSVAQAIVVQGQ